MRVFKYRGGDASILRRDLTTLARNSIYAASWESLNDPWEFGARPAKTLNSVERVFSRLVDWMFPNDPESTTFFDPHSFLENPALRELGVYSLSKTPSHELLWAHYGASHTGFCIEYELEELVRFVPDAYPLDVRYQTELPKIRRWDLLKIVMSEVMLVGRFFNPKYIAHKLFATKSLSWAYEEEIRIVFSRTGLFGFDHRAVKAVYFGHRCKESFQKLTMRVLRGRGITFYRMVRSDEAYRMNFTEIADLKDGDKAYLQPIASVNPSIFSDLSALRKPIPQGEPRLVRYPLSQTERMQLLSKAIEFARREPACRHVTGAWSLEDDEVFSGESLCVSYLDQRGRTIERVFRRGLLERVSLEVFGDSSRAYQRQDTI